MEIMKLFFTKDEDLYDKTIEDFFDKEVFDSDFWLYWRTMFAFENWHSALEMKLYIQRFIHHIGGLPDFSALKFTKYNQYESLILPMQKYLEAAGVKFQFNTRVENVIFEFKDGKIVKATSNNTDYMNEILDIDEGARYVGEFAFGVNPVINHPIGDILFDEKIAGSFHFTPGNSYDNASNGNKSAVHWDLIQIQTPEYGGGEIWFDDVLIRKDGLFVLDDLKCLNPENLLSEDE